jgi:hypothetical protein
VSFNKDTPAEPKQGVFESIGGADPSTGRGYQASAEQRQQLGALTRHQQSKGNNWVH